MINFVERRKSVMQILKQNGVELLALGPTDNMTYLHGFHPHPDERSCLYLITPNSEGFLMPKLNAEEARQRTEVPMETYADADGPVSALTRLLETLGLRSPSSVALDETMRTDFSLLLLGQLPSAKPLLASAILGELRMRKDAQEIALIQANAEIADEAIRAAYRAVCVGVTERGIAAAATDAFKAADVDSVNFTIVASGPNGAYPHHHTGRRELREGDAVVIDIGARKSSYNSDITRMAYIGTPDKTYRRVHKVVEEAVMAALETVRPGVRTGEVDRAARQVIERAGYGEYFVHRTGHGLGLAGHEPPYITETSDVILIEGMVFSIEPGVYLPDKFGVRLEEIVAVTATGVRIFSHLPRDLHQVPV